MEEGREESLISKGEVKAHRLGSADSLLYEVPGGNLVDGLPPAASTAGGDEGLAVWTKHMCGKAGLQI